MISLGILFILLAITIAVVWLSSLPKAATSNDDIRKARVPAWHKNATIYEVNLRHYTPAGTFRSFEAELPRLKGMGIDILWLMPINPISVKNRKGELGSPYAVADYFDVNPDYGTMVDFKHLLAAIHAQDMYCIIDWVPNHTGWDNPWINEHPNWYTQDADGNIIDPIDYNTGKSWGWTDVADLNYDIPEMRQGMIDAMKYWIADIGIDGFRVDVAHGVPVDFWADCSDALYAIKPIFMLAEAEVPAIRNNGAFVMDYAWEMHHLFNEIAQYQGANRAAGSKLVQGNLVEGEGAEAVKKTALDIDAMLAKKALVNKAGYAMHFTSNHDENSWSGTEFQRMGDGHKAFAVLAATFDGMPLIYSGQESALDKQLEFFKRDIIEWGDYAYEDFYRRLFALKHRNQALWNGKEGGALMKVPTTKDENVYAFVREKNGDQVLVIINLSAASQNVQLNSKLVNGEYQEIFTNKNLKFVSGQELMLGAWEYHVLEQK
ncbi:MAG: alpha-amylase family glycosyl hydrolase [Bacteroidia bacterium]